MRQYENPIDFIPTAVLIDELKKRSDEGVEVVVQDSPQSRTTVLIWQRGKKVTKDVD